MSPGRDCGRRGTNWEAVPEIPSGLSPERRQMLKLKTGWSSAAAEPCAMPLATLGGLSMGSCTLHSVHARVCPCGDLAPCPSRLCRPFPSTVNREAQPSPVVGFGVWR